MGFDGWNIKLAYLVFTGEIYTSIPLNDWLDNSIGNIAGNSKVAFGNSIGNSKNTIW